MATSHRRAFRKTQRVSYFALAALVLVCDAAGPELQPVPDAIPRLRVASLSPAATHLVVALGAEELLVVPTPDDLAAAAAAGSDDLDLLLVPAWDDDVALRQLLARGVDVIEVTPHDFDSTFELVRLLGVRLGREQAADTLVREMSRPLARISAESRGQPRPRVAAVLSLDPLTIAGGHGFATDLIEVAGAENVVHGSEEAQLVLTPSALASLSPDLVLVTSERELTPGEQTIARALLPEQLVIAFFALDPETLWSRDPGVLARSLRDVIRGLTLSTK